MQRKQIFIAASIFAACLIVGVGGFAAYQHWSSAPKANTPGSTQAKADDTPAEPTFNKTQFSTTGPTSPWVIVNKVHPLNPLSYAPTDLVSVGNNQRMRAEAAAALQQMFADAQAAGFTLVADSGYRSYNTQVSTYASIAKAYGVAHADTVSAHPGYSEHQTGWAVDIGTGSCHVQDCFGDTPGGQWAQANAHTYGFLLRYPDTLTTITGYSHEAWHFRYVGKTLSQELHKQDIRTLEQFFNVDGGTTYK